MIRSCLVLILLWTWNCYGQSSSSSRAAAEYYLAAYAQHYGVPLDFARAVVEQESGWQACVRSPMGAVGIMQVMPQTAIRLGVRNRCDVEQNISGGMRYLAWLMHKFHGELRLVAAAYYAGERRVERRGLAYSNRDVVIYVASIRQHFEQQRRIWNAPANALQGEHNEKSPSNHRLSVTDLHSGARTGNQNHSQGGESGGQ